MNRTCALGGMLHVTLGMLGGATSAAAMGTLGGATRAAAMGAITSAPEGW